MRNIKVEAKSVDMAIDKGLQMLGLSREDVEVKVLSEGSMLKKASVEIYTFGSEDERKEYLEGISSETQDVKLVKTGEQETEVINFEGVEEITPIVTEFLTNMLKYMNINGTVSRGVRNGDVIFKISGDEIGNLIGYHGETLEAIQYILNTIVRNSHLGYHKKIYIDAENYRRKRQDTVESMAERIAKKVLTSKKSIKLEPMNSFERKSIHYALSNIEHIATHSEGNEPNRCLVISYVD